MLDDKGFDLWADQYDEAVDISDDDNVYPFAGYKEVLGEIYKRIMKTPDAEVLDVGFGTAVLTARLYENGCTIYGQDFSSKMINIATEKMPNAHLYKGDFSKGLVKPLSDRKYDFIIATYSLHHITDEQKVKLLSSFQKQLRENGLILIGDIAFNTRKELDECKEATPDWDDEEIYIVAEEFKNKFPNLVFDQISYCAGILTINGKSEIN